MIRGVPQFDELYGQEVVIDTGAPYVFLGTLIATQAEFFVLTDCDAHDLRDTQTTREKYVLNSRKFGFAVNRNTIWVHRRDVVAISRLSDVVLED